LKKCLAMKEAAFASVREVEGLAADVTREQYVQAQVNSTLVPDGMHALRTGFWELLSASSNTLRGGMTSKELQQILCPVETQDKNLVTDFRKVFKVSMEDDMANCPALANGFWEVVNGFSVQEKKLFLRFFTGVDTPPEPLTERLIIQLPFAAFTQDEHAMMLGKLPQAHACSNTIELPNYYESLMECGQWMEDATEAQIAKEVRRIIGERLRFAIQETAGYELDAVEADRLADERGDALLLEAEHEVRLIAEAQLLGEIRPKSQSGTPPVARPNSTPRPPAFELGGGGGPGECFTAPPPPGNPPPEANEAVSPLALFRASGASTQSPLPPLKQQSGDQQAWMAGSTWDRVETLSRDLEKDEQEAEKADKSFQLISDLVLNNDLSLKSFDPDKETHKILAHRASVDSLLEELEVGLKDDGWSPGMLH